MEDMKTAYKTLFKKPE